MKKQQLFDWEHTLDLNISFLRVLGLWPKTGYKLDLYTGYTVVLLLSQYSLFILESSKLFYVSSDLVAAIDVCLFLTAQVLNCVKIATIARNSGEIRELFAMLRDELFQPKTPVQCRMMVTKMTLWQLMYNVIIGILLFFMSLWILLPILTGSYRNLTLPIPVVCPYCTKAPIFVAFYVFVSLAIASLVISAFNINLFVFALLVAIEVQFEILGDNLKGLEGKFWEELLRCVKHHQLLLKFTSRANKLCDFIIFFQFLLCILLISLMVLQANLLPTGSLNFYSRASASLVFITQIFVFCWFGDNIETKSGQLLYSVFQSSWVRESLLVKKVLLLLSLNLSTVKISAFNIFYMSLVVFVKLMKSAYSFLMLFRQFADDF